MNIELTKEEYEFTQAILTSTMHNRRVWLPEEVTLYEKFGLTIPETDEYIVSED